MELKISPPKSIATKKVCYNGTSFFWCVYFRPKMTILLSHSFFFFVIIFVQCQMEVKNVQLNLVLKILSLATQTLVQMDMDLHFYKGKN